MSTMRKIIIPLLLFIYLIGSGIIPPLMGIRNSVNKTSSALTHQQPTKK